MKSKSGLYIVLSVGCASILVWKLMTASFSADSDCDLRGLKSCDLVSFYMNIHKIESAVIDLTSPDDLFAVEDFVAIYENSDKHFGCALKGLVSDSLSETQKTIVLLSMKKVESSCYSELVNICFALTLKDSKNEGLLKTAILSPFGKSHPFIENYATSVNLSLIDRMLSSNVSSKFKETLLKVKSSELLSKLKNENL